MQQTPIWVPILVASITAVVGTLGGQLLSGFLTARREREEQLREERISAYSNFVKVSQGNLKRLGVKQWEDHADQDREELGEAWSVIQLVAGSQEAREAAEELYEEHMEILDQLQNARIRDGEDIDSGYTNAIQNRRQAFIVAALRDIGNSAGA